MEIRLLGAVGLRHRDREIALARPHRRCVLAVLAMTPGQPVSADSLVDRVWGDQPPRESRHSLYTHISAVRRLLEAIDGGDDRATLRRAGGGYLLEVDPDRVDLHRARRYAAEARGLAEGWAAVELLRRACRLWQGAPLAGLNGDWADRVRAGLEQERLALLVERFRLELRLGEHGAAVGPLGVLRADHPLVEPLAGLQMLALYRCGRQAEALEAYAQTRRRLIDELGDEPGAELRRLHEQILRRDPTLELPAVATERRATATIPAQRAAVQVPPAQLPPDVVGFTGRTTDLARLDSLLVGHRDAQPDAVLVAAIAGAAGVGKTALAVHWAHRVRDRFPDGQLHVNLRGYASGPPLAPVEALAKVLHTLGVPGREVPADAEEAAAILRSLLAGKRVLVVLDDAAEPEQVRPLLPTGAGSMALVTSRDRLTGLAAQEGAQQLSLDTLPPDEARKLLARSVGSERAEQEPAAITELADLCGFLPLALRIAAANLAARPQRRIADYVQRLRDHDRLAALAVPGEPHHAVSAAFDLSLARLPEPAQRMFRLLGLAPGPDITAEAAAALASAGTDEAEQLLETLAAAHLAEEHAPGRYALHDLLRRYAVDRAAREETGPSRGAAQARLYDYYLSTVDAAASVLYPETLRLPPPARAGAVGGRFPDQAQARRWLDDELACLVAVARQAAVAGPLPVSWQLCDALRGYFIMCQRGADWLAVADAGLAAAEVDNSLAGQASVRVSLADAHASQGRHPHAVEQYQYALTAAQQLGSGGGDHAAWSVQLEAAVLNNLGVLHYQREQLPEAADHYTRALAISRRAGSRLGEATQLANLGRVYERRGQLRRAIEHQERALALDREAGNRAAEREVLLGLGIAHHELGNFDQAIGHLTEARTLYRLARDRRNEGVTQDHLAAVYRDLGRPDAALATAALSLAREVEDRRAEASALNTLATVKHKRGQHEQAIAVHQQAAELASRIKASHPHAEALLGMAVTHHHLGGHQRARDLLAQAITIAEETGFRIIEGRALTVLAEVHLADGEHGESCELGERALAIHLETGHRLGEARTRLVLGRARHRAGEHGETRQQWRRAYALFAELGTPEVDQAPPRRLPRGRRRSCR